jgi:sterol desaturase/sphingolipid hydroxylase (fatty acid hydroxylase superfamily)
MSAVDVFGLLVPLTYLLMLGIETLFPARQFPAIRYWRLKGLLFLIVQGLLAALTPLLIPEPWLAQHRLMNLESLGVIGGAALGYAVVSLINYAWHRSAHTFPLMWRLFHQIHHSPQGRHVGRGTIPPAGDINVPGDRERHHHAGARS